VSISISISADDAGIGSRLEQLFAGLTDRTELNEAIAKQELNLTRDYLTEIASYRHKTAESLGGTPTGFLAKAAEQTSMSADGKTATVTIRSPGIGRVDHDVTIVPTEGRQWLTPPMAGISYGRTVSQIQEMIGKRLFRPLKKGAKAIGHKVDERHTAIFASEDRMKVLAASDGAGGLKLYFALVASVTQPQDRTLLPSDQAYSDRALAALRDWLDYVLFWKEGA
jgi:hypothetical protein